MTNLFKFNLLCNFFIQGSSQPKILSTGNSVQMGSKNVPVSVVIGNNLKTSGGRKVKIVCAVSGWPIPKVVWHKNGEPVEHPTTKLQVGTAMGSMLVIDDATEKDSGIYTCYAINPAGVAMSSSHVKILGELPRHSRFLLSKNIMHSFIN